MIWTLVLLAVLFAVLLALLTLLLHREGASWAGVIAYHRTRRSRP